MIEAAKAAIRWAKEEFGLEKVFGSADCANLGSRKVMERVVRETATGEVRVGEKWYDWPVEKLVEGREVRSVSRTWEWNV